MSALKKIKNLPEEITNNINLEFGCVEFLYKNVFDLYEEDYRLFKLKQPGSESRLKEIKKELTKVENRLNDFGMDGKAILKSISNDHEEALLSKLVNDLNSYMQ